MTDSKRTDEAYEAREATRGRIRFLEDRLLDETRIRHSIFNMYV